jgi:DNA-binding NarL/FixJ family response regulator
LTHKNNNPVTIGVTDDEQLFVKSLALLINTFNRFTTVLEALSGEDLIKKLDAGVQKPDILLLDVNMKLMDGIQTATRVAQQFPTIKLVALSTKDDDTTIINMLKAGCCAYLVKDIHPNELEKALDEINNKGYYNADAANINYRRLMLHDQKQEGIQLNEREKNFLQLACSDLTYKQIAAQMHLSERTIDGYREAIFEKFNVQSRVGMAMEAIRRKIVSV